MKRRSVFSSAQSACNDDDMFSVNIDGKGHLRGGFFLHFRCDDRLSSCSSLRNLRAFVFNKSPSIACSHFFLPTVRRPSPGCCRRVDVSEFCVFSPGTSPLGCCGHSLVVFGLSPISEGRTSLSINTDRLHRQMRLRRQIYNN